MILNCPSCTMRYLVSEGAVGPAGRMVRCAHCGHKWFQEGEEGLDAELFAAEAALGELSDETMESVTADFMSDEEEGDNMLEETPFAPSPKELELPHDSEFHNILQKELEDKPIPAGVLPSHGKDDPTILPMPAKKPFLNLTPEKISGFVTAASLWFVLSAGFLFFQEPITRAWPPSNYLYDLVGMKPIPPGDGLALEDLTAKQQDGKIVLSGKIINLREVEKDVPTIMASIIDRDEKVLDRVLIKPPVARLKVNGQAEFAQDYPKMPDGAHGVTYAFSYAVSD